MSDLSAIKNAVSPIAARYGVESVSLFGSRAMGDNKPDSDYDFLISKGNVDSLWLYVALVNDLEDALKAHVDVVTDTSSDASLLLNAKREGILIYEQER